MSRLWNFCRGKRDIDFFREKREVLRMLDAFSASVSKKPKTALDPRFHTKEKMGGLFQASQEERTDESGQPLAVFSPPKPLFQEMAKKGKLGVNHLKKWETKKEASDKKRITTLQEKRKTFLKKFDKSDVPSASQSDYNSKKMGKYILSIIPPAPLTPPTSPLLQIPSNLLYSKKVFPNNGSSYAIRNRSVATAFPLPKSFGMDNDGAANAKKIKDHMTLLTKLQGLIEQITVAEEAGAWPDSKLLKAIQNTQKQYLKNLVQYHRLAKNFLDNAQAQLEAGYRGEAVKSKSLDADITQLKEKKASFETALTLTENDISTKTAALETLLAETSPPNEKVANLRNDIADLRVQKNKTEFLLANTKEKLSVFLQVEIVRAKGNRAQQLLSEMSHDDELWGSLVRSWDAGAIDTGYDYTVDELTAAGIPLGGEVGEFLVFLVMTGKTDPATIIEKLKGKPTKMAAIANYVSSRGNIKLPQILITILGEDNAPIAVQQYYSNIRFQREKKTEEIDKSLAGFEEKHFGMEHDIDVPKTAQLFFAQYASQKNLPPLDDWILEKPVKKGGVTLSLNPKLAQISYLTNKTGEKKSLSTLSIPEVQQLITYIRQHQESRLSGERGKRAAEKMGDDEGFLAKGVEGMKNLFDSGMEGKLAVFVLLFGAFKMFKNPKLGIAMKVGALALAVDQYSLENNGESLLKKYGLLSMGAEYVGTPAVTEIDFVANLAASGELTLNTMEEEALNHSKRNEMMIQMGEVPMDEMIKWHESVYNTIGSIRKGSDIFAEMPPSLHWEKTGMQDKGEAALLAMGLFRLSLRRIAFTHSPDKDGSHDSHTSAEKGLQIVKEQLSRDKNGNLFLDENISYSDFLLTMQYAGMLQMSREVPRNMFESLGQGAQRVYENLVPRFAHFGNLAGQKMSEWFAAVKNIYGPEIFTKMNVFIDKGIFTLGTTIDTSKNYISGFVRGHPAVIKLKNGVYTLFVEAPFKVLEFGVETTAMGVDMALNYAALEAEKARFGMTKAEASSTPNIITRLAGGTFSTEYASLKNALTATTAPIMYANIQAAITSLTKKKKNNNDTWRIKKLIIDFVPLSSNSTTSVLKAFALKFKDALGAYELDKALPKSAQEQIMEYWGMDQESLNSLWKELISSSNNKLQQLAKANGHPNIQNLTTLQLANMLSGSDFVLAKIAKAIKDISITLAGGTITASELLLRIGGVAPAFIIDSLDIASKVSPNGTIGTDTLDIILKGIESLRPKQKSASAHPKEGGHKELWDIINDHNGSVNKNRGTDYIWVRQQLVNIFYSHYKNRVKPFSAGTFSSLPAKRSVKKGNNFILTGRNMLLQSREYYSKIINGGSVTLIIDGQSFSIDFPVASSSSPAVRSTAQVSNNILLALTKIRSVAKIRYNLP